MSNFTITYTVTNQLNLEADNAHEAYNSASSLLSDEFEDFNIEFVKEEVTSPSSSYISMTSLLSSSAQSTTSTEASYAPLVPEGTTSGYTRAY